MDNRLYSKGNSDAWNASGLFWIKIRGYCSKDFNSPSWASTPNTLSWATIVFMLTVLGSRNTLPRVNSYQRRINMSGLVTVTSTKECYYFIYCFRLVLVVHGSSLNWWINYSLLDCNSCHKISSWSSSQRVLLSLFSVCSSLVIWIYTIFKTSYKLLNLLN